MELGEVCLEKVGVERFDGDGAKVGVDRLDDGGAKVGVDRFDDGGAKVDRLDGWEKERLGGDEKLGADLPPSPEESRRD